MKHLSDEQVRVLQTLIAEGILSNEKLAEMFNLDVEQIINQRILVIDRQINHLPDVVQYYHWLKNARAELKKMRKA